MFNGNNSESILVLKEKFDEIKQNISLIEQRQTQFFHQTRRPEKHYIFKRSDSVQRPSSVSRYAETTDSYKRTEVSFARKDKETLESDNEELVRINDRQKRTINVLSEENKRLKEEVERLKSDKRPVPCLKHDGSTPRTHRVAFSKNLVQVMDPQESRATYSKADGYSNKRANYPDCYMKYHPVTKYFKSHFYSTSPVAVARKDYSVENRNRFRTIRNDSYSPNYHSKLTNQH